MKSTLKILLGILVLSIFQFSCTEDQNPDKKEIEIIQSEVIVGTWKITLFEDSGVNETAHFAGYSFQFSDLGVINASNGSSSYSGTWSVESDDDDDSPSDLDFNIYFNLTNDFEELNDDWEIVTHTATKIELRDISGGDGDVEYLTFEKN